MKTLLVAMMVVFVAGCADLGALRGSLPAGATLYDASECLGAVVNGVCLGDVIPEARYHQACYGQMIGGVCTGAQF